MSTPPAGTRSPELTSQFINLMLAQDDVAFVDKDGLRVMCKVCQRYISMRTPPKLPPSSGSQSSFSQTGDQDLERMWKLDWSMHRQNHGLQIAAFSDTSAAISASAAQTSGSLSLSPSLSHSSSGSASAHRLAMRKRPQTAHGGIVGLPPPRSPSSYSSHSHSHSGSLSPNGMHYSKSIQPLHLHGTAPASCISIPMGHGNRTGGRLISPTMHHRHQVPNAHGHARPSTAVGSPGSPPFPPPTSINPPRGYHPPEYYRPSTSHTSSPLASSSGSRTYHHQPNPLGLPSFHEAPPSSYNGGSERYQRTAQEEAKHRKRTSMPPLKVHTERSSSSQNPNRMSLSNLLNEGASGASAVAEEGSFGSPIEIDTDDSESKGFFHSKRNGSGKKSGRSFTYERTTQRANGVVCEQSPRAIDHTKPFTNYLNGPSWRWPPIHAHGALVASGGHGRGHGYGYHLGNERGEGNLNIVGSDSGMRGVYSPKIGNTAQIERSKGESEGERRIHGRHTTYNTSVCRESCCTGIKASWEKADSERSDSPILPHTPGPALRGKHLEVPEIRIVDVDSAVQSTGDGDELQEGGDPGLSTVAVVERGKDGETVLWDGSGSVNGTERLGWTPDPKQLVLKPASFDSDFGNDHERERGCLCEFGPGPVHSTHTRSINHEQRPHSKVHRSRHSGRGWSRESYHPFYPRLHRHRHSSPSPSPSHHEEKQQPHTGDSRSLRVIWQPARPQVDSDIGMLQDSEWTKLPTYRHQSCLSNSCVDDSGGTIAFVA